MTQYAPVIGLEVHAQLSTRSKLFCGCSTKFGAPPNANTCEVCLALPGTLPVLNAQSVTFAIRAGLGLDCTVHPVAQWSRKNYFYPDLSKGYQITQADRPICTGGHLEIQVGDAKKVIGITRIHMEEDAGKNVHDDFSSDGRSYVDFNRAGIPLIEIVSEPDLRSSDEAVAYLKAIRQVLRYLQVCDGNMDEGSLRCDANVSIRPVGSETFGTRVELKNINSFRFVQQAIEYEILRQTDVLNSGDKVVQETRLWDTQAKVTRAMRSKEEAHDYRYFPDPDLPLLVLGDTEVADVRKHLPELPGAKRVRYTKALSLSEYDATILTADAEIAHFFEAALARHNNVKSVANWVINDVLREVKDSPLTALKFGPEAIGELVALIDTGVISGKIAKDIFEEMLKTGTDPSKIVDAKGLQQVSDVSTIEPIVDEILAANQESVEKFKSGKSNLLGFLVGLVMKATQGKANPKLVSDMILKKIS